MSLEVSKLFERLGCKRVRLAEAVTAGEASGSWSFSGEFESLDAWGKFGDDISADPELLAVMSRIRAVNSPIVIQQQSIAIELSVRTPKPGRGRLTEVYVSRPTPGRFEDAVAMAARACAFAESKGAVNGRVSQLNHAGMGVGNLLVTWEHESSRALAGLLQAWGEDAEAMEIASELNAASPSSTLVFSGVYADIPL
jgi:hypothetical protein